MSHVAQLGIGSVRHKRLRPVHHAFAYPVFFLRLPMRTLRDDPGAAGGLAFQRRGLLSFRGEDHGDGRVDALAWLDECLRGGGIHDATGEAWLHCFPRMYGHTFKPVSFWYCHRADGSLRAVVAEVNNTFGERHCYLLEDVRWGHETIAPKRFPVSPFCATAGAYRFRFMLSGDGRRTVVRIDHDDAEGPLLLTSVGGTLQPATRGALLRAALRFPFLTAGIVLRIHWHALRLWLARVPVHSRARARPLEISR
jgi:DUF1365 family protein